MALHKLGENGISLVDKTRRMCAHSVPISARPRLMYSMGTLASSGLTATMILGFGCLGSGRESLLGSDLAGTWCCDWWTGPAAKL